MLLLLWSALPFSPATASRPPYSQDPGAVCIKDSTCDTSPTNVYTCQDILCTNASPNPNIQCASY